MRTVAHCAVSDWVYSAEDAVAFAVGGKLRCRRTIIHPGSISSFFPSSSQTPVPDFFFGALALSLSPARIHSAAFISGKVNIPQKGLRSVGRSLGRRRTELCKVHFKKKACKKRGLAPSSVGLNPPPPPLPPFHSFFGFLPSGLLGVSHPSKAMAG